MITTAKEVVLTLTRFEAEQLYRLLSCLLAQLRREVEGGKSEEIITLALNGKAFVASEVRTHIHGKVAIHIS